LQPEEEEVIMTMGVGLQEVLS